MSDRTLHTRQETLAGGTAPGPLLDTATRRHAGTRGPNVRFTLSISYPHPAARPPLYFTCTLHSLHSGLYVD